jgi:hypothetical protein
MNTIRFDRTVRVVIWLDALLSALLALLCVVASPVVATLGVPRGSGLVLAVALIGCAVVLAAFGAVTAVLLSLRMRDGGYDLAKVRLPLPAIMRPD